jgi:hypothetical protein
MMKTSAKKSKESSVQPRKLARKAFRCGGVKVRKSAVMLMKASPAGIVAA